MSETRIVCCLSLPIDIGPMSPNRILGRHWSVRKKHKATASRTAYVIWHNAGSPRANQPVLVTYTVRRPRKLDGDNALAALKAVTDCLFKGRITRDDSPDFVTFNPVIQVVTPRGTAAPSVDVLVEEL